MGVVFQPFPIPRPERLISALPLPPVAPAPRGKRLGLFPNLSRQALRFIRPIEKKSVTHGLYAPECVFWEMEGSSTK